MVQMIGPYGLGVALYAFLNRVDMDSPYYIVGKYILTHMDELQDVSIKELASKTNVSIASISRFVKEIGLDNFGELRTLINNRQKSTEPRYEYHTAEKTDNIVEDYFSAVKNDIDQLAQTIDMSKLNQLVDDLYAYQEVVTFGAMHMETVSLMLQNNLFRCKKIIETRLDPGKQIDFVENQQKDLLVIIFSLSGNYVREYLANISDKKKLKIYVVTKNEAVKELKYVYEAILLPTDADSFSAHPLDSLLLVNLITLIYYEKYVKNKLN